MTEIEHQSDAPSGGGTDDAHRETNGVVHNVSHGHSTAAWTCVLVVTVGFLVACLGVVFTLLWLFVVGAVVVVVGGALGKVLSAMGFGAAGRSGH